jgi:hypothetical protein
MMSLKQMLLSHQRERIRLEYTQKTQLEALKGKQYVYPNQKEAANKVIQHYNAGKRMVMLIAQPGTGKTGTVSEVTIQVATHIDDELCVPAENIWVISGMNDTDWRDQFSKNSLDSFKQNIHHRGVLLKHTQDIANIENGLIITDECHIASGKNMTVSKLIKNAGLTDIHVAETRNVKMLDISATPESVSYDLETWGDKAAIVKLMPGPTYKGFEVMLNENRIREAPGLSSLSEVMTMFEFLDQRYASTTKKFFPMRALPSQYGNIHIAIAALGWRFITHDSKDRIEKIDELMSTAPEKHTVIFIKEFWRASKRLIRTHVGGTYEKVPKTQNVTSTAQSLPARFADNYEYSGDEENPDLRPIHFTDVEAVRAYINWFNSDCDYRTANYKCSRIESKDGVVKAQQSKVHESNMTNLDQPVVLQPPVVVGERVPVICQITSVMFSEIMKKRSLEKFELVKSLLISNYEADVNYAEFLSVIREKACFQISKPSVDTKRSYKIHVEDVVTANLTNKPLKVMDLLKEERRKTNWEVFMDEKNFRMCVLWQKY